MQWGLPAGLALTALVVFVVFGPFRRVFFRWRSAIEPVVGARGRGAIVLIHGTYARNSRWTESGHPLVAELQEKLPKCDIFRLRWSGDNYHGSRLEAAEELRNWIENHREYTHVLLVGHSHGGTVAALAASWCPTRRVKVVTLSTPFIQTSHRHATMLRMGPDRDNEREEIRLHRGFLVYGFVAWVFGLVALEKVLPPFVLLLGLIVVPVCLAMGVSRTAEKLKQLATDTVRRSAVRIPANALMIIRTTGDEATGVMALGQLLSWIGLTLLRLPAHFLRILFRFEDRVVRIKRIYRIYLSYVFLPVMGWGGMAIRSNSNFEVLVGYLLLSIGVMGPVLLLNLMSAILSPALTLLAIPGAILTNLPFGMDLAVRSTVLTVTVEPAPTGTWPISLVPSGEVLLAHSVLYDSPALPDLVVKFFNDVAGWTLSYGPVDFYAARDAHAALLEQGGFDVRVMELPEWRPQLTSTSASPPLIWGHRIRTGAHEVGTIV